MSNNTHICVFSGYLGRDPEKRVMDTGKPVVKFSIANNRGYKAASGERVEKTVWKDVVVFDSLAEFCYSYLKKGSRVTVTGPLDQRNYTGRDGSEKREESIKAYEVELLDKAPPREESDGGNLSQPDKPSGRAEITDDDLPF